MLTSLQERVDSSQLSGNVSINSRHVTALLRCILAALQGPEKRQEAEQKLKELDSELQSRQDQEQPILKRGNAVNKEAEILRACVAKAGPSVYDSLDVAIRNAKEVCRQYPAHCKRIFIVELAKKPHQLPSALLTGLEQRLFFMTLV